MTVEERAINFACNGDSLVGILHVPAHPRTQAVLIAVGGPQYRAGSHRQFVLIARALAALGYAVLRFDYRGMGDSKGAMRNFEHVEDDLCVAVGELVRNISCIRKVVIWGLCDGASAAALYGWQDPRVNGLILVNPWVRTDAGEATTMLKHYYRSRLFDRSLWQKIGRGELDYGGAARSILSIAKRAIRAGFLTERTALTSLPQRLYQGLQRFPGMVLVLLSENDLTAQEFREVSQSSREWGALMEATRITCYNLAGANHTFSRRDFREQVIRWTAEWLEHCADERPMVSGKPYL